MYDSYNQSLVIEYSGPNNLQWFNNTLGVLANNPLYEDQVSQSVSRTLLLRGVRGGVRQPAGSVHTPSPTPHPHLTPCSHYLLSHSGRVVQRVRRLLSSAAVGHDARQVGAPSSHSH